MGLLLPQLPFAFDDLEPAMSEDALSFHFARHHLDHFERTAALAQRAGLGHLTLEELVCSASRAPRLRTLYRHAAEAWNHACFWESMRAGGGGAAYGAIGDCLRERFGSYERFARRFHGVAATLFGSRPSPGARPFASPHHATASAAGELRSHPRPGQGVR